MPSPAPMRLPPTPRRRALQCLLADALPAPLLPDAASLSLLGNRPVQRAFVDLPALPDGFGRGGLRSGCGSGPVRRRRWARSGASKRQLRNGPDADPEPYSGPGRWLTGNRLLGGMTRPRCTARTDARSPRSAAPSFPDAKALPPCAPA